VLVTHDATLAACADRRIVLRDGLIVSDEMNSDPQRPVRQMPTGTAADA
jgi:putative ABC transport system ATP-binding protein